MTPANGNAMEARIERVGELRFDDGSPVPSASAIAPFGDGWLVAQDDSTHPAWWRPGGVSAVRVLAAVEGHEVFSAAAGTKHRVAGALGIDVAQLNLEGACRVGHTFRWVQPAQPHRGAAVGERRRRAHRPRGRPHRGARARGRGDDGQAR